MKKDFVITQNVKKFMGAVQSVLEAPDGIDRMALVYGDPGLGKTETAVWWVNHYGKGAVFIRTKKLMTGRWLLEEIVRELGESPAWKTSVLFNQAVGALIGTDRVVILDEIDHLAGDARVIETLRDIHDITNSPFIFIGMDNADRKLKRYRHLWRRFIKVVKFEPLDKNDTSMVLRQICGIEIDDSAINEICARNHLTISKLYRWAMQLEAVAKSRSLDRITGDDLKNSTAKGK